MPKDVNQFDSGEVLESDENTPDPKPPDPKPKELLTVLKPSYTNSGMNTKSLVVPGTPIVTRSKGRLMLDNNVIPLDDTIETFVRTRKKPYKEVEYKDKYTPDEFEEPMEEPTSRKSARLGETKLRRSERLKANFTKWEPSRITNAMTAAKSGLTFLPSSIHATASTPTETKTEPIVQDNTLESTDKLEELRAYHAELDLQSAIDKPEQSDVDWHVENIETWEYRKDRGENKVFLKVVWFGGDKQWLSIKVLRLHDPYLLKRYAFKNKLTKLQGWKWTKYFKDLEELIPELVKANKVTSLLKTIKFGVTVPQSTKHALQLDLDNKDNLWKESMKSEIDSLQEHGTFKVLEDGKPIPEGYKWIPYHCIYDVKFDGRRQCRLVAGGHMTDPATEDVYSGVVDMEIVRIVFVVARINGLLIVAGDVGNAFFYGITK